MKNWYLNELYTTKEHPTLTFAFQGTIHWMRALAILVNNESYSKQNLKKFYSKVSSRSKKNQEADINTLDNLMKSIHYLDSLKVVNESVKNPYSIARIQIVSWYYSIYYASSAMLGGLLGYDADTHSHTARIWQQVVENKLVLPPFNLSIKTVLKNDIEKTMEKLRGSNTNNLNICPTNAEEALGAIFSYLQGTANYRQWEIEEDIKRSKDFKKLKVKNFRTKDARNLRDKKFENSLVNFLTMAFRYRGKANYRDSLFLSYGKDRSDELSQFLKDLETVATEFLKMASCYSKSRVDRKNWKNFIEDLETNLRFDFDLSTIDF